MDTKTKIEAIVRKIIYLHPEHRIKVQDLGEKKDGKEVISWTVSILVSADKYGTIFVNGQIIESMGKNGFGLVGVSFREEYLIDSGTKRPVLNALFNVPFFLFPNKRVKA